MNKIKELVWYWYTFRKYEFNKKKGKFWLAVANAAPRSFIYWAVIRCYAYVWMKAGNRTPDEITFGELLKTWENKRWSPDAS